VQGRDDEAGRLGVASPRGAERARPAARVLGVGSGLG
jgi:hypothetical protein